MRTSRYTDEQVAFALKQAELGTPVAEVCRKMAVSEASVLPLEAEVWRPGAVGAAETPAARGGEQQAEEACGRSQPGQDHAAGRSAAKCMVRPASASLSSGWSTTVRVNVSGLSRVSRGCGQAVMRSARGVPIKPYRLGACFFGARLTPRRSTVSSSFPQPRKPGRTTLLPRRQDRPVGRARPAG